MEKLEAEMLQSWSMVAVILVPSGGRLELQLTAINVSAFTNQKIGVVTYTMDNIKNKMDKYSDKIKVSNCKYLSFVYQGWDIFRSEY